MTHLITKATFALKPMGIAGLWAGCKNPKDGEILRSFIVLIANADHHPFIRNYHEPEDEKRMVVILDDADDGAWLSTASEARMSFMRQFPAKRKQVKSD